jgi:hypothetical protein
MTGYICRKAGVPDIQTDSAEVKTAAELSGYICTSGELAEHTREAVEEVQTDWKFVCRKALVPDIYGSDDSLKTACELNGYICTSV